MAGHNKRIWMNEWMADLDVVRRHLTLCVPAWHTAAWRYCTKSFTSDLIRYCACSVIKHAVHLIDQINCCLYRTQMQCVRCPHPATGLRVLDTDRRCERPIKTFSPTVELDCDAKLGSYNYYVKWCFLYYSTAALMFVWHAQYNKHRSRIRILWILKNFKIHEFYWILKMPTEFYFLNSVV